MISVRVNEILKYLSSDKKERLKRCVLMESSQKLDNSRTLRNNVANALSSSSSSSSSVSVGFESGPEKWSLGSSGSYQMPPMTSSGLTVEGADDEELKAKEKFQSNSGDNELHKDCKKRRPLTVLKNHNVQCLPSSYSSSPTPETSLSIAPNTLFIPSNLSSHDVKQHNGYKYVVPAKSDTKKNPIPAVSRGQFQLDSLVDSVKRETKSHTETSDVAGTAPKGKSKQIENRKHSKRKTGSLSAVTVETKDAPVEMTVTKESLPVGNKRLSESESIDHHPPATTSSPLCLSSRRSKKQNKQKDAAYSKIPEHIGNPSHELNGLSDIASPQLGDVKTSSKLRNSVEEHSKERSSTKEDKKLDRMKSNCVWPGRYASMSGVAELDTFEITSGRNQKLAAKRMPADKHIADHSQVSSSNEVNALDTFDEPVGRPVTRRSVDTSSSVPQKQKDVAEKWIQVNRKVKRVVVPSRLVSHILGSNGSKLEAICQVTRAHIELEKTTNPGETIFVLRGTLEQMQAASNMISALMNSKSFSDGAESGNVTHSKNGSPVHSTPQAPVTTSKELKTSLKLVQPPVPISVTNNAIDSEKSAPPQILQVNVLVGFGQNDDDYPDSILSSASERSDSCSERCSPSQDLLIGEYSLFEHGLGQPLEKLLARKDSSKQTFARAAAIRMQSRTLTPIIPNRSAIDQLLLAKAPGYRNAKVIYGRDACFAKAADLASHMPTGRFGWPMPITSGRGLEPRGAKENDPSRCTASQLFSVDSSHSHIPSPERPLSAPGFPSAHSSSSSAALRAAHDRSATPADHLLTMHTFSNLNPNAPDFVFTLAHEEASGNRIGGMLSLEPCGSQLLRSPVNPSTNGCGCPRTDGSAGEFSYSMSRLGGTFESVSVDVSDSNPCVGQDGVFTLTGSAADDEIYDPPWLCSQEPWYPSKMSYSGMGRGEHVLPCGTTAIASYPSRGDLYRNYFAHPPFSPIASPYNCAFYQQQQQNMMLTPVQSWSHAAQTVAPAGP